MNSQAIRAIGMETVRQFEFDVKRIGAAASDRMALHIHLKGNGNPCATADDHRDVAGFRWPNLNGLFQCDDLAVLSRKWSQEAASHAFHIGLVSRMHDFLWCVFASATP